MESSASRLAAVLLGTAVGDAAGLPWEGMGAVSVRRRIERGITFPLGGRVSDDTEQSVLVVRAWAQARGDVAAFEAALGRSLRWWLVCLPPGVGFGTLRALAKRWLGGRVGVASEGNGAAMRAAALGVLVPEGELAAWVLASSRITHTSAAAIEGALVVARAAACGARHGPQRGDHLGPILAAAPDPRLRANLELAVAHARTGARADALAAAMGAPGFVTGWVSHTVPMAVHLWLVHADVAGAVTAAIGQGGDTDSVAAITGALVGATTGEVPWVDQLRDRPLSGPWIGRFAEQVLGGAVPPSFLVPLWLARNLWTLAVIVVHLATRRLP